MHPQVNVENLSDEEDSIEIADEDPGLDNSMQQD